MPANFFDPPAPIREWITNQVPSFFSVGIGFRFKYYVRICKVLHKLLPCWIATCFNGINWYLYESRIMISRLNESSSSFQSFCSFLWELQRLLAVEPTPLFLRCGHCFVAITPVKNPEDTLAKLELNLPDKMEWILTYCDLVMPYAIVGLDQYWFSWVPVISASISLLKQADLSSTGPTIQTSRRCK